MGFDFEKGRVDTDKKVLVKEKKVAKVYADLLMIMQPLVMSKKLLVIKPL
jgi:hypothetical protein